MATDTPALTPEQRASVATLGGPVLVVAEVGAGKTRVLAERAVHALERDRPAATMLALTFTFSASATRAFDPASARVI